MYCGFDYLHGTLINSVVYVCSFFLIKLFDIQINGSWNSHEAVINSVPNRMVQAFIAWTWIDGESEVVTNLKQQRKTF